MRIGLVVFALLTLAAAAAVGRAGFRGQERCSSQVEQTVTGLADRDVLIVDEVCDTEIERVYLQTRDSRRRWLIFSYERMGPSPMLQREDVPPTVTWLDSRHLRIDIDVVSQVFERREVVEGIHVQYRIGREMYPAPPGSPSAG
jgi:hypothetical protein